MTDKSFYIGITSTKYAYRITNQVKESLKNMYFKVKIMKIVCTRRFIQNQLLSPYENCVAASLGTNATHVLEYCENRRRRKGKKTTFYKNFFFNVT